MPFQKDDVVKYVASSRELSGSVGRVCDRQGSLFVWVRFEDLGCKLVRESSLEAATGSPPRCTGCPP
jgi:hypothetical protein